MKKIFRKNQIIITALALMIAVAGYISYTRANVAENDAIQKTQGPDLRPRQRPMGEMQRKYRIREKRCRRQPRHRVWRLHRR